MICSFGDRETERIWNGTTSRKFPYEIQQVARRKLRMIQSATDLKDLRIPPANQLEKLKGDLAAFYSIRVNSRWRIIFVWDRSNAFDVTLVDYH
jgi:proteic killer suppression protein